MLILRMIKPSKIISLNIVRLFVLAMMIGAAHTVAAQSGAADSTEIQAPQLTAIESAREQFALVQADLDSLLRLEKRSLTAEDEDLKLIRVQARQQIDIIDAWQSAIIKTWSSLDPEDAETQEFFGEVRDFHERKLDLYARALRFWEDRIATLRNQRIDVAQDAMVDLETEITIARGRLDKIIGGLNSVLEDATELGIDVGDSWQKFDLIVNSRTETLVGRLQIAVNNREELKQKLESAKRAGATPSELMNKREQVQMASDRITGVAESLAVSVDLLSSRGFETSKFNRFLITTTGEITERFFDPKVFIGLVQDFGGKVWQWLSDNGPTLLVKLFIVIITTFAFRWSFRFIWWAMRATGLVKLTRLMTQLGHSVIVPIASFMGVFTGLWLVGVDPTTLLTGAGVAGIIIGLALQDSLSNLAAGFFLLTTRPFDVDDVIRAGDVLGTVKVMTIANTTIITFDGRRLLVPNRMLWAGVIENRSVEARRRVDVVVRVAFDEDINRALEVIQELLKADSRVLESPAPDVFVANWEDSWVEIAVRPWVRTEMWWNLYTNLAREVVLRFAGEGIEIPLPRRVITSPGGQPPAGSVQ